MVNPSCVYIIIRENDVLRLQVQNLMTNQIYELTQTYAFVYLALTAKQLPEAHLFGASAKKRPIAQALTKLSALNLILPLHEKTP